MWTENNNKEWLLGELTRIREQLYGVRPRNTVESLSLFESQITLNEISACALFANSEEMSEKLETILALHCERVYNSSTCYTKEDHNPVNQLCFEIAKKLNPENPYKLLIPKLQVIEDTYGNTIGSQSLGLNAVALSDDATRFIAIADCLYLAAVSDDG